MVQTAEVVMEFVTSSRRRRFIGRRRHSCVPTPDVFAQQRDPAGHEYRATAFVFGELGNQAKSIKKNRETTVLRAHGHARLEGRGLRRSRGRIFAPSTCTSSRLLEAGWPLHHVQEMLGHASIDQTTTYLRPETANKRLIN
jgi:integrase